MNFKDLESQTEFRLEDVPSLGVMRRAYFGYSILILLSEEDAVKISYIAKLCGARNPVHRRMLRLETDRISIKQEAELLDKGVTDILVYFRVTGVCTKSASAAKHHLIFKVTKLRKLGKPEEDDIPED